MFSLGAEVPIFAALQSQVTPGNGSLLGLLFGGLVGLTLGLTGGGGSVFGVPLLVYGLAVNPREAMGISLAAVGTTAFIGSLRRIAWGEVEIRTGLLFAVAGMLGAPAGAWLGGRLSEPVMLILFAGLTVAIAVRLWAKAARATGEVEAVQAPVDCAVHMGPACRTDPTGRLHLSSRCFAVLLASGSLAGLLSGLFGVGGGFVIVPSLVLVSDMRIDRAVATSLLVIALVSLSGVAAYLAAARSLPLGLTGLFIVGGMCGMELGTRLGRRLAGPGLQKLFAIAMLGVAVFIVIKSLS